MAYTRKFGRNNNYYGHDDQFPKYFRCLTYQEVRKYRDANMTFRDRKVDPLRAKLSYPNSGRIRNRNMTYVRGKNVAKSPYQPYQWFKVTLYHGKSYDRCCVMNQLKDYIRPVLFLPFGTRLEDDNLIFFINDKKTSIAIQQANLKLRMTDGSLMQIKVEPKLLNIDMTTILKENIARVISLKYNNTTMHLDLSTFHVNKDFLKQDLLAPLNRPNVALAVFQTTNENIPRLRSLNLSNNKISTTEYFSLLKKHADWLKSIDLSKNLINNLTDLRCLEGLKLESLVLDDNPLCDRFRDQKIYVREVRKIFPTLISLDRVKLSPPTSQPQPPMNLDGENFTKQFLELFYSMYDNPSGDRSALNKAYALTGEFSLTTSNFSGVDSNKFVTENRTLIRVNNHLAGRTELLLIGTQNIVKFLSTLPKTKHDVSSFLVDLLLFTPELVSLRISGVFREVEYISSPVKAFNREFTLISNGSGFSIVKDALCVTEPSSEQASTSFGSPTSNKQVLDVSNLLKTSLSLNNETTSTSSLEPLPSNSGISQERQNMIQTLAVQTGMNLLWSKKCLDETNWEPRKALEVFTEFHKINAIPAEAFA